MNEILHACRGNATKMASVATKMASVATKMAKIATKMAKILGGFTVIPSLIVKNLTKKK